MKSIKPFVLMCIACNGVFANDHSLFGEQGSKAIEKETSTIVQFPIATYPQQVVDGLLEEVNDVVRALHLDERLPIVESNLVRKFIAPPRFAREYGGIGSVTTRSYTYSASVGNKLSFIIGTHQLEDCLSWERNYLWPTSRMDTNAAYRLATQWLSAVSIDVAALNRDYRLRIEPDKIYVRSPPDKFVPAYWVGWYKKQEPNPNFIVSEKQEWESVASVFLFLPNQKLLQMRVEDPRYILRKAIQITDTNTAGRMR